ncbi:MAG: hypothetical protein IPP57_04320 [Candidatus Obscuribacter sp.]|jgi:hypothetical protein|nr:hypothetical protein [Candidatus Obscuribacter sp.]
MAREDKGGATGSYQEPGAGKSGDQDNGSLAARRARLRGSLAKQTVPPDPYIPSPSETVELDTLSQTGEQATISANSAIDVDAKPAFTADSHDSSIEAAVMAAVPDLTRVESAPVQIEPDVPANFQDPLSKVEIDMRASVTDPVSSNTGLEQLLAQNNAQVVELLNTLDQQLGVCSVNLSQISKAANEQLELVRNLAETVQNQAFGEIGLSLNSLSESMSAALEPMKAVGELVPALDTLVLAMSGRPPETPKEDNGLTPEQLVASLADQLSSGRIDPWTFKCAYMAVFPSEHPADLLRKLVDLLGTQRISGEFFRAAYDAVQAAEPPKPVYNFAAAAPTGDRTVQDEAVMQQLEALRLANEQLKERMDQREMEFAELLQSKETEVSETQEMLNSRWEEFSSRYEQLSEVVRERNEQLLIKEAELNRLQSERDMELNRLQSEREMELLRMQSEVSTKETEISQLKTQLEEMRDQTKDMVADLQRQLTSTKQAVEEAAKVKVEVPKPQTSFFEAAAAQQAAQPAQPQLFNPNPIPDPVPQPAPMPAPAPVQSLANDLVSNASGTLGAGAEQLNTAAMSSAPALAAGGQPGALGGGNQAIPRPQVAAPTTPFPGTSGSYGSGVRAQVFEVIVRQALAGAPWREICAGPMQVNNISPDEVEVEVKRRQEFLKK